jgi:hypothetical protein
MRPSQFRGKVGSRGARCAAVASPQVVRWFRLKHGPCRRFVTWRAAGRSVRDVSRCVHHPSTTGAGRTGPLPAGWKSVRARSWVRRLVRADNVPVFERSHRQVPNRVRGTLTKEVSNVATDIDVSFKRHEPAKADPVVQASDGQGQPLGRWIDLANNAARYAVAPD